MENENLTVIVYEIHSIGESEDWVLKLKDEYHREFYAILPSENMPFFHPICLNDEFECNINFTSEENLLKKYDGYCGHLKGASATINGIPNHAKEFNRGYGDMFEAPWKESNYDDSTRRGTSDDVWEWAYNTLLRECTEFIRENYSSLSGNHAELTIEITPELIKKYPKTMNEILNNPEAALLTLAQALTINGFPQCATIDCHSDKKYDLWQGEGLLRLKVPSKPLDLNINSLCNFDGVISHVTYDHSVLKDAYVKCDYMDEPNTVFRRDYSKQLYNYLITTKDDCCDDIKEQEGYIKHCFDCRKYKVIDDNPVFTKCTVFGLNNSDLEFIYEMPSYDFSVGDSVNISGFLGDNNKFMVTHMDIIEKHDEPQLKSTLKSNDDSKVNIDRESREYREWRKYHLKKQDKCVVCGHDENLQVHHQFCVKQYPELIVDKGNGVVLCKHCHRKFHEIYGVDDNTPANFAEFQRKFMVRT